MTVTRRFNKCRRLIFIGSVHIGTRTQQELGNLNLPPPAYGKHQGRYASWRAGIDVCANRNQVFDRRHLLFLYGVQKRRPAVAVCGVDVRAQRNHFGNARHIAAARRSSQRGLPQQMRSGAVPRLFSGTQCALFALRRNAHFGAVGEQKANALHVPCCGGKGKGGVSLCVARVGIRTVFQQGRNHFAVPVF